MAKLFLALFLVFGLQLSAEGPAWVQTSTEHFTFVYRPVDGETAGRIIGFAEDVYRQVTDYFHYRPAHVWAVIRGTTDEFNGFFALEPDRLNLFIAPPTTTVISAYSDEYLRNLLAHEFTHYVHLTQEKGIGSATWVLGPDAPLFNQIFLPGWVVEGITTNTEGLFATGGRARNPFFEMEYKAPILEHKMWTYDQAGYGSYQPPGGDRIYVSGFMMVDYLRSVWGEEAFNQVYLDFVEDPLATFWGYNRSLERFTGKPNREFFTDAQNFMAARFRDDGNLAPGKLFTPAEPGNWYLPYKTDLGWVGYAEPLNRAPGVYLETEGKATLLFPVTLSDPHAFGVSSDGRTVIYSSAFTSGQSSEPESDTTKFQLWVWTDGTHRRLAPGTGFSSPRLTPDGTAWYAIHREGTSQTLVKGDLTGRFVPVYSAPRHLLQTAEVSPDGRSVALAENIAGHQVITVVDETGRVIDRIDAGAAAYLPRWTDGTHLLFSTDKAGRMDLWVVDLENKTYRLLPRDPVGNAEGALDGDGILYQTDTPEGWAVKRFPSLGEVVDHPLPGPEQPLPGVPVPGPTPPPAPKPFMDTPTFDLAFPSVSASTNGSAVYLGGGYGFQGNSVLETQSWSVTGLYFPTLGVPAGSAAYSWRAEGWQGGVQVGQNLSPTQEDFVLDQQAVLWAQVPWGERDTPQWTDRTSTELAVEGSRTGDFTDVTVSEGTTWTLADANPPESQFFGGWGVGAYSGVTLTPALASQLQPRWDFDEIVSGSAVWGPLVLRSQVHATSDSTGNLVLTLPSYQPEPVSTGNGNDWRSDFQITLLWPLGVRDANLLGLGILRQGFSTWVDTGVQGDWTRPAVWDQGLTCGMEFDTDFQVGRMNLPFYLGVAAQLGYSGGPAGIPTVYLGFNVASTFDGLIPRAMR